MRRISAWSKPIISKNVSVAANSCRAEAILMAASAVTATLGMAGFRKWAITSRSSSVSSSSVTLRAMAWAIRAMVRSASPLPVFSCWASNTRVWLWASMASLLVGLASFTTPTSVTVRPVAAANWVAVIRIFSTCGERLPCASWPNAGFSPVSGLVVAAMIAPTYCRNLSDTMVSYCSSVTPRMYFCGVVSNSSAMAALATTRT